MTFEPSKQESKASASPSVSWSDLGDGIFSIQIAAAGNNTLSQELAGQLLQALNAVQKEASVRVLILSGTAQAFLRGGRREYNQAVEQKLYHAIASFPYPVIAAMQGDATGAGFLAGALCDFMICSAGSNYYYTNREEGLYPSSKEYKLFEERFGEVAATDFLYLSSASTGAQLKEKGWTCPVLPAVEVETYAKKLAASLAGKSETSLRLLKKHLSRQILSLADELVVVNPLASESKNGKAHSDITSPAKHLALETHEGSTLVIRIRAAKKEYGLKALVADLKNIFTQADKASHYKSVVLVSEYNNFLPDTTAEAAASDVSDFQNLVLDCRVPVIAVLDTDTKGIAWLAALFCDVCVYNAKAGYSAGNIWQSKEMARQAGLIFAERLGSYAGKEILLTGKEYTARELQRVAGAIHIAEKEQTLPAALKLAANMAKWPSDTLSARKKEETSRIREKMKSLPTWSVEKEETSKAQTTAPAPIALASKVISATAYPEGILVVKMEDREAKNMFSEAFIQGMNEVFGHVEKTPSYKVVVLTGYDNYFASGGTKGDLLSIQEGKTKFTDNRIYQIAMTCKVPVIAAMQGHGIGGGWNLGMFADLVLFSEESKYFSPYMTYGFTPGAGATFIFPERIGYDLTRETLLTAEEHSGSELKEKGLRMPVLPREQVSKAAMELARQIANRSRGSLVAFKRQLTQDLYKPLEETYQLELAMHEKTFVGQQDTLKQINDNFHKESVPPSMEMTKEEKAVPQVTITLSEETDILPDVAATVKKLLADELHMQEHDIDENTQFIDLGLDSITGVTWMRKINERYKTKIDAIKVYSYPTLAKLSRFVKEEVEKKGTLSARPEVSKPEVSLSTVKAAPVQQPQSAPSITLSAQNTDSLPEVTAALRKLLSAELHMQEHEIDENTQFIDLGLDSITGVTWVRKINEKYKTRVEAIKVYSYPTLAKLSRYVKEEAEKRGTLTSTPEVVTPAIPVAEIQLQSEPVSIELPQEADSLPAVTATLRTLLANELHMPANEIDENTQFIDLGLDSITSVTWIRKINEKYKTRVEATKVYSYPTLAKLSRYVKEEAEKKGTLPKAEKTSISKPSLPLSIPVAPQSVNTARPVTRKLVSLRNKPSVKNKPETSPSAQMQPIAVIGMAGQFPQANNLEEFWQNISQGKNCIGEVPQQRWDVNTYFQEGGAIPGKTNSKWTGALEEYDMFDPLFFSISPTEAENMDPQQRVFLQACWHAIENAGYNPQKLSGSRCGVFVGCGQGDYRLLSKDLQISALGFTGGDTSILAARISYFLNLQGPNWSIETACSSSLVAIANACDSLIAGNSDLALAGGVYVMTGPEVHIKCAQMGMLSTDGKCYTFDQRANGFVPGEGVGVVMLKRLADAERDQDMILGVIQGWGVNQDGKTNGITAPNSESQTRLEQEVYDKFHIDPAQIQLVEAHGTGTKLGDPIEVDALKQAFMKYTQKTGYCALGSVKSNIGHCLTAAGVASFIKVIQALNHKQLPPTINYNSLNEHITLEDSPFYVNSRLLEWKTGEAERRHAAISAFGFSGTNAHIVLAEYLAPVKNNATVTAITQNGKVIVPLSARNEEQLKQKAIDLLAFIRKERSLDLISVAYTLQVGREEMEERLGFLAGSLQELTEKLRDYIDNKENIADFYRWKVKRNKADLRALIQDDDMKGALVEQYIGQRKLSKLLELWAKGLELDWNKLYGAVKPQRVALPGYPFAKERYWVNTVESVQVSKKEVMKSALHPLLHSNTSNFREQSYSSAFTGEELFLKDHQVNGHKVLPGVAYLEMARAAVENAMPDKPESSILELHDTVWMQPIVVDGNKEVSIALFASEVEGGLPERIDYGVYTRDEEEEILHCQGQAVFVSKPAPVKLDLVQLKKQMQRGRLESANIYGIFTRMGFNYGPAHQSITTIYIGANQLLAQLQLPAVAEAGQDDFQLHPSLMDCALQASIGLIADRKDGLNKPILPFALDSLSIISACTREMMVWVRYSPGSGPDDKVMKLDIDLCDPQGNVCVQMKGFKSRILENEIRAAQPKAASVSVSHNGKESKDQFDQTYYQKLIEGILKNEVSIDEAVNLG